MMAVTINPILEGCFSKTMIIAPPARRTKGELADVPLLDSFKVKCILSVNGAIGHHAILGRLLQFLIVR